MVSGGSWISGTKGGKQTVQHEGSPQRDPLCFLSVNGFILAIVVVLRLRNFVAVHSSV